MIKGNQSKHGPRNLNNTSTECALQFQCANIIPNQPKGANMDIRTANENRIKFHISHLIRIEQYRGAQSDIWRGAGEKRPKCKCHRNKKLWKKHTHLPLHFDL